MSLAAEPTFAWDAPPAPSPAPTRVLAGRYELGPCLGAGGFGAVYEARDTLTGDAVAVKRVRAVDEVGQFRVRRELAALRWLRLPGVVQLRDDGLEDGDWVIVMDRVEGELFDEAAWRGAPWAAWRPQLIQLLETLAQVHQAGILHLDLKPANVMVTPDGEVVVLDFGLAQGHAAPRAVPGRVEGTPRYMAPEQRAGRACDARTDLYAVGVMVREMLLGDPDSDDPLPVPPADAAVLRALTARHPADRPDSAWAALRGLGGGSETQLVDRGAPWTRSELRQLIAGHDHLHHVPSDAANLLFARTAGDADRLQQELDRWVRAGRARWENGQVVVDRMSLERLDEDDLARQLTSETPVDEVIWCAITRARNAHEQGLIDRSLAVLDAITPLLEDGPLEDAVHTERAIAALKSQGVRHVELALHHLERSRPWSEHMEQLGSLLQLAICAFRYERTRALLLSARSKPFEQEDLEILRQGARFRVAQANHADELLRELRAWATTPRRRSAIAEWTGLHLYRLARYADAAISHRKALACAEDGAFLPGQLVNLASAELEALDLRGAATHAAEARTLAASARHVALEAMACFIERTAHYRSGTPVEPDPILRDAAADVGPYEDGLLSATDAAAAWRLGHHDAAALARRAATAFRAVSGRYQRMLFTAFAAHLEGADRETWMDLAAEAADCPVPDLALQVLACASWALPDEADAWRERRWALANTRPTTQWSTWLDILSVEEALAELPPR